MENPELLSYIRQHLAGNFTSADIKTALLQAGWGEQQVNEAMQSVQNPVPAVVAEIKPVAAVAAPVTPAVSVAPQQNTQPTSFQASEIVFETPSLDQQNAQTTTVPDVILPAAGSSGARRRTFPFVSVAEGVIIVVLLGGVIWLYKSNTNTDLKDQVANLTAQNASLSSQIETLTVSNKDAQDQLKAATDENVDIKSKLSLFTTFNNISVVVPITLKGTVSTSSGFYIVTTADNFVVTVKNSKDKQIDTLLKPLVGSQVELSAVPVSALYQITVKSVNGTVVAQ